MKTVATYNMLANQLPAGFEMEYTIETYLNDPYNYYPVACKKTSDYSWLKIWLLGGKFELENTGKRVTKTKDFKKILDAIKRIK